MRIAVDLDGVLADTMVTWCRILNSKRSMNVTVDSLVKWRAWEIAHVSKDEFYRILDKSWYEWENIPPTEEDLGRQVGRLNQFGLVDIVTGRSKETIRFARSWLKKYEIRYDSFVRTQSTNAKAELDYDLFIDDSPDLMPLVASKVDGWAILYTRPWNRDASLLPRVFRADKWDEIPKLVERIPL